MVRLLDFDGLSVGFKCRGGGGRPPPPFDSTLRRGELGSDLSRCKSPFSSSRPAKQWHATAKQQSLTYNLKMFVGCS